MRDLDRGTKRKVAEQKPTPRAARSRKAASAVPNMAEHSSSKEEEGAVVRPALETIDVRSDADKDESTDEEIIASLLSAMIDRVRDIFDGLFSHPGHRPPTRQARDKRGGWLSARARSAPRGAHTARAPQLLGPAWGPRHRWSARRPLRGSRTGPRFESSCQEASLRLPTFFGRARDWYMYV